MSCKKNKQKEVGIGTFFNKSLFKTFTYVSRPAKHQRAFKLKNKQIKNWAAFMVLLGNDEGKIINFYHQNFYLSNRMISFLKNRHPSPFSFIFCLSNKHYNFYSKYVWKMSIQYTGMGFEPTIFKTWVSSHNH